MLTAIVINFYPVHFIIYSSLSNSVITPILIYWRSAYVCFLDFSFISWSNVIIYDYF